ncbi:MAG: lysostaphin resistance A-like protein [Dehalococcoidia bacterium]
MFLQISTTAVFLGILAASSHNFHLEDAGEDVFDRAGAIWQWGDERLKAATEGSELPDAPQIFADVTSLKIGFATTMAYELGLVALCYLLMRQRGLRQTIRALHLREFSFDDLWVPIGLVIVMYGFVIGWGIFADYTDIELLKPRSNVPEPIVRDGLALAMAGVLACVLAPLSEELFFRGFLFRGLLRWGFWPAAGLSGFIFSLAHLSTGALIPFWVVGMVLAWLAWRRGRMWDAIVFHFLFNTTSYVLLASGAGGRNV